MLIPSRTKYRRVHRLPYEGKARGNTELKFGKDSKQYQAAQTIVQGYQNSKLLAGSIGAVDIKMQSGGGYPEPKEEKEEKIEVCYTCGKEFDMNSDEGAHYHYGKYPMCGYCTNFFGFYQEDLMDKK